MITPLLATDTSLYILGFGVKLIKSILGSSSCGKILRSVTPLKFSTTHRAFLSHSASISSFVLVSIQTPYERVEQSS